MSGNRDRAHDEMLLIDFLLRQCDEATVQAVRQRLADDAPFRALHRDVSSAFAALAHDAPAEPPADLVDRTLGRLRAQRQTEALIQSHSLPRQGPPSSFTIREMAALAAVLVLAVGILLPSIRQSGRQAQRVVCAENLGQMGRALAQYAALHDEQLPAAVQPEAAWLPRADGACASNSAALFQLISAGYASPSVFQCPAAGGVTFAVKAGMVDFPTGRNINYSYQHSLQRRLRVSDPAIRAASRQMVVVADANPLFPGGRFQPAALAKSVSDNHADGGHNVLYLTGQVDWRTHCRVGVNGDNIFLAEGVSDYTGTEGPSSPTDSFLLPNPR